MATLGIEGVMEEIRHNEGKSTTRGKGTFALCSAMEGKKDAERKRNSSNK